MHAGAGPTATASRGTGDQAIRPAGPPDLETRVADAALRCIGRWGVAKTTLDDVAREAGCSRASVYRVFPGGKDALLTTLAAREAAGLFAAVDTRLAAAADLEEAVVGGVVEAARFVTGHAALQFVLAYEPALVLPHLAFSRMDTILARAAAFVAPRLGRWLPPDDTGRAAEWLCRLVVSYLICPSEDVELTDAASVRSLVRRFVLPALGRGRAEPAGGPPRPGTDTRTTTNASALARLGGIPQ